MATPKGTRAKNFPINETDAVHIYSDRSKIWLQLRRDHPTEDSIAISSFKSALNLTPVQAIAIAGELLSVAAEQQKNAVTPAASINGASESPHPENHGKAWTPQEDKQLSSRFHSGLSIEEIARKHKRGLGGIQSRLTKLGKLSPDK